MAILILMITSIINVGIYVALRMVTEKKGGIKTTGTLRYFRETSNLVDLESSRPNLTEEYKIYWYNKNLGKPIIEFEVDDNKYLGEYFLTITPDMGDVGDELTIRYFGKPKDYCYITIDDKKFLEQRQQIKRIMKKLFYSVGVIIIIEILMIIGG